MSGGDHAIPAPAMLAPQQGSAAQWSVTRNNPAIAQYWDSIAPKNYVQYFWYNKYDESNWDVIGQMASSILNWIEQNGPPIVQGFEMVAVRVGNHRNRCRRR